MDIIHNENSTKKRVKNAPPTTSTLEFTMFQVFRYIYIIYLYYSFNSFTVGILIYLNKRLKMVVTHFRLYEIKSKALKNHEVLNQVSTNVKKL